MLAQAQTHTTCPLCGEQFAIATIAEHPEVVPIGMLFEDEIYHHHMYYFNHVAAHCGTTFVVPVEAFLPFITEPVPGALLMGTEWCEHRCTHVEDLQACSQLCRYAPYRRHMVSMLKRHAISVEKRTSK